MYPESNSVPVFGPHQIPSIKKSKPICYAEKENAAWMVGCKIANWRSNYKAIQLRREFLVKDAAIDQSRIDTAVGNGRLAEERQRAEWWKKLRQMMAEMENS